MADKHQIDGHKLIYHPERVAQWTQGSESWDQAKSIYPIYVEIAPIGGCNHRCTFCAVDYIGYKTRSIEPELLKTRLGEMARLGIKSVMFAGEGEPTLYKALPEILDHCTEVGIDTSLTTNMVPFTTNNVESFVRNCKWIKTSINAGTAETYAQIHQCKPDDFNRVLDNFAMAVETRKKIKSTCTIGGQIVLLPENADEVSELAEKLRKIGVDYLVVKPYSQHNSSVTRQYESIDYSNYLNLKNDLESLSDDNFSVVFRNATMERTLEKDFEFKVCQATPFFWAYIMANGEVYGCSAYLEDERFCYGNITDESFEEIWEGDKRKQNHHFVLHELNIEECRHNCRMWSVNQYLNKLKNPTDHVNFI
ncbi:MAG: radical SAM protein [Nitrospinae bacterium CG11_big_fil_rev_8_21_14_0_20_45_15]|nr:MAG: radical SAM protein [Nitrospinae bacterium CG11_big_fil_rev_8_21_14_0_20_45_15]